MAGAQVHVAGIELSEVGDQEHGGATLASREVLDVRDELAAGGTREGRSVCLLVPPGRAGSGPKRGPKLDAGVEPG
jgi:hypothetical protein